MFTTYQCLPPTSVTAADMLCYYKIESYAYLHTIMRKVIRQAYLGNLLPWIKIKQRIWKYASTTPLLAYVSLERNV